MTGATSPFEYLSAELQWLDLLLHREILRLRATYQLSLDEFRGLYVSDEQVDRLIAQERHRNPSTPAELTARVEALRAADGRRSSAGAAWGRLAGEFALCPIEQDVLLLALAPEIDLKYETLYAYLNNDVTRKWPTFDLALRVLSDEPPQRAQLRRFLLPSSTLLACHLLRLVESQGHASSLATGFTVAPVLAQCLLGQPGIDPRLAPFAQLTEPRPLAGASSLWNQVPLAEDELARLARVAALFRSLKGSPLPLLILEGRPGAGQALAAGALCKDLGLALLRVDLEGARASGEPLLKLIEAAILQSRLTSAGLYLEGVDVLFDGNGKPLAEAQGVITTLARHNRPVFLACPPGMRLQELVRRSPVLTFPFGEPPYAARLRIWCDELRRRAVSFEEPEIELLAGRFALNLDQIQSAITSAVDAHGLSVPTQPLGVHELFQAAREQSDGSLGSLAAKVNLIHTWDDLVLPAATLARVRELAGAIRYRHVVYSEWGFERRIASGHGVKALFAGESGTGKTMAASVLARDLDLDLYKVDLSAVVSKYIGETEKNLDKIFRAADSANAILFFDEADALFGKRSEVKEAHDRYANIEVAYLLQKVDDHEGVVILASNLKQNIDDAFSRRLHYVIDFPLPDERQREILWRQMFPPEAPLGDDIDWGFLARQFAIAGGDIKNVALEAAFLAAQGGQVVTMSDLIKAMARQLAKQGRILSATDFRQYYPLVERRE